MNQLTRFLDDSSPWRATPDSVIRIVVCDYFISNATSDLFIQFGIKFRDGELRFETFDEFQQVTRPVSRAAAERVRQSLLSASVDQPADESPLRLRCGVRSAGCQVRDAPSSGKRVYEKFILI